MMVVVAVRGRSPDELEPLPTPDAGIRPVTSSRRIRDFRSSSSSHTEDAAVVDTVDAESTPPPPRLETDAGKSLSARPERGLSSSCGGEELRVRGSLPLAGLARVRGLASAVENSRE